MITQQLSFEEWLDKIDELFINNFGMSLHDLEDYDYYDMYESGYSIIDAFEEASEEIVTL